MGRAGERRRRCVCGSAAAACAPCRPPRPRSTVTDVRARSRSDGGGGGSDASRPLARAGRSSLRWQSPSRTCTTKRTRRRQVSSVCGGTTRFKFWLRGPTRCIPAYASLDGRPTLLAFRRPELTSCTRAAQIHQGFDKYTHRHQE